jgi:hypothetical protein
MSGQLQRLPNFALGAAALLAFLAHPASAEIQKLMAMCPGQKLCAWYKAVVSPPPGWAEDKEFGGSHFITALFPDQPKVGPDAPLIYLQVSLHQDNQTLEENIAQNQGIWRKSEPEAKITPLPDVPRGGEHAPFKVFLYENPTHPKQAFELTAFTLEKQPDGTHYIITVVDTASSRKAIDASRDAYTAVLGSL